MPDIDLNFLRAAVTVLSFITFLGIVVWVLARRNKAGFDEAAQLPFAGEGLAIGGSGQTSRSESMESGVAR